MVVEISKLQRYPSLQSASDRARQIVRLSLDVGFGSSTVYLFKDDGTTDVYSATRDCQRVARVTVNRWVKESAGGMEMLVDRGDVPCIFVE